MSAKPLSPLRWLAALAVLALIIGVLLNKTSDNRKTPEAPAEVISTPAVDNHNELIPLPPLTALQQIDLDKAPARRTLDLQHWVTEEGARVYFMQAAEVPMLDLQLLFAAGASRDGDSSGLASMTNAMLNEGAGGKDAGEIAAGFEQLGAEFSNSSHRDMALVGLRSLTASDKLDSALGLFTQVISKPDFPADAFERLRNQMLASLQFRLQNPGALGSEAFWSALYPQHPYGSLPQGQPDTLQNLSPDALRAFHQRHYSAGNAVIALVGDIDRQQAERIAARLSRQLPAGPAAPEIVAPAALEAQHVHVEFNSQQTHILLGQHGINRHDDDYTALFVGNQILGGSGFGSRLMEEIREKRGLSYSVSSSLVPMQATGPYMISMQTRSDQVPLALEVINQVLDEFIANGPTDAELIRSKRQILGEFPLSTASNSAIVSQLGMIGFYNLPLNHLQLFLDQVEKLSAEQIRDAFARRLPADQRVIVTVGPTPAPEDEAPETENAATEPDA